VKFVKIGLTDDNLNTLLNFIKNLKNIQSLVITNNLLTDEALNIIDNFVER
jgi:hypothetical protein